MKLAELRREYLRRLHGEHVLCALCRFAEAFDWGEECRHPLAMRVDLGGALGMEPGDDCWAFRPARDMGLDVIDQRIAEWLEQEES